MPSSAGVFLFAGTEVAAQSLPVRLTAKCGRDLVPGPVGTTGLSHSHLDCLLSDAPSVDRRPDQLIDCGRHTTDRAILNGICRAGAWRSVAFDNLRE